MVWRIRKIEKNKKIGMQWNGWNEGQTNGKLVSIIFFWSFSVKLWLKVFSLKKIVLYWAKLLATDNILVIVKLKILILGTNFSFSAQLLL